MIYSYRKSFKTPDWYSLDSEELVERFKVFLDWVVMHEEEMALEVADAAWEEVEEVRSLMAERGIEIV